MMLSGHSAAVYPFKFSSSGHTGVVILRQQHPAVGRLQRVPRPQKCSPGGAVDLRQRARHVRVDQQDAGALERRERRPRQEVGGHTTDDNSCCPVTSGPTLLASSSDGWTTKLWDVHCKPSIDSFEKKFQVTAVCFSADHSQVIAGGLDGDIKMWDLRKDEVGTAQQRHADISKGVTLSLDGSFLLSNAMDSTMRKRDIRPSVRREHLKTTSMGAKYSFDSTLIRSRLIE